MKNRIKNVSIIILSLALIISIAIIVYLLSNKFNAIQEIEGKVIVVDKNYLIIESSEEDYLINGSKNEYEIGDIVKFKYKTKNLNSKNSPKSIKIDDEKLVEKTEDEHLDDDNEPEIPPVIDKNPPVIDKDKEVLNYFQNLEKDFKSGSIKESLKDGFITVVDFLFYEGKIKGYKFSDLSDSAKLKVLSMVLYFDEKIDTYFPDYKESISSTSGKIYTNVKKDIVESYLNVTTKVCEYNEDLCITAKNGFQTLKKNFGLTWELIKDIAGDGLDKIKKWYEIFSNKR